MEIEIPLEVERQLAKLEDVVQKLSEGLEAMGPLELKGIAKSSLTPCEQAKAHLALAMASNALLQIQCQLDGRDPSSSEPLQKEQKRLQVYTEKVRRAINKHEVATSRRSLDLDVAAVNRFITHAVSDKQQRKQLREIGSKRPTSERREEKKAAAPTSMADFVQDVMSSVLQG